jgi:hypothetical protein
MSTPPFPFPGDDLAVEHHDGGWEYSGDGSHRSLRRMPILRTQSGPWCAQRAEYPYRDWVCCLTADPDRAHNWHVATLGPARGNRVVAVWQEPTDIAVADWLSGLTQIGAPR